MYIYLASTYSVGKTPDVKASKHTKHNRYKKALQYTTECTKRGEVIFSPIVYSHHMAESIGDDWATWEKVDKVFIDGCSKVRVLMLPGWKRSKGIAAEVAYAQSIGKEVEHVEPTS